MTREEAFDVRMKKRLTPKQRETLEALRVPGHWGKSFYGVGLHFHTDDWQSLNRATVNALIRKGLLTLKAERALAREGQLKLTQEGMAELGMEVAE